MVVVCNINLVRAIGDKSIVNVAELTHVCAYDSTSNVSARIGEETKKRKDMCVVGCCNCI